MMASRFLHPARFTPSVNGKSPTAARHRVTPRSVPSPPPSAALCQHLPRVLPGRALPRTEMPGTAGYGFLIPSVPQSRGMMLHRYLAQTPGWVTHGGLCPSAPRGTDLEGVTGRPQGWLHLRSAAGAGVCLHLGAFLCPMALAPSRGKTSMGPCAEAKSRQRGCRQMISRAVQS